MPNAAKEIGRKGCDLYPESLKSGSGFFFLTIHEMLAA